jgi:thioredoxin 1
MTYIGYGVVGLLVVVVLLQWRLARKAKAMEGAAAPELEPAVAAKLRQRGRVLLYFFSPSCGPCRAFTPVIDRVAARHDNVFKFDVGRSQGVARQLGVMATPTTVLVVEGRIAQVALGSVSEQKLEELLG